MSFGIVLQRTRLLSDVLDESDTYKFKLGALTIPSSKKEDEDDLLLNSTMLKLSASAEDPDTESDENGSPSSFTSVSSSDDENSGDSTRRTENVEDEDDNLFRKGPVDERACAKLLQSKINAVLDRIEFDSTEATTNILKGCVSLPSDLKYELLLSSVARKTITDDMIRCFLSTTLIKDKEQGTDLAHDLKQLSLFGCQNVTDSGLETIAKCCPQLQALDLTGCRGLTAQGLQHIIRSCCELSELCLSGCPAFCDKTISTIFRFNNPSHIRCLSVRRCDIHDFGLSAIASYCPTLQKLDIRSCGLITSAGIRSLIQRVPTITMLSCGRCVGMDDLALRHLAQGYGASLTDLNLDMCWRVSTRGVTELAHSCKQLRSINLNSCTAVDDSALKAICRNPYLRNSLQAVNLNECNIGDDALEELVVNCSSLVFVSVVGCPRVSYQRAVRIAQLAGIQIVI